MDSKTYERALAELNERHEKEVAKCNSFEKTNQPKIQEGVCTLRKKLNEAKALEDQLSELFSKIELFATEDLIRRTGMRSNHSYVFEIDVGIDNNEFHSASRRLAGPVRLGLSIVTGLTNCEEAREITTRHKQILDEVAKRYGLDFCRYIAINSIF